MKPARFTAARCAVALVALVSGACGGAGAQDRGARQSVPSETGQESERAGFFERLLRPEPEPVVVPAGTTVALQLRDTLSSHETPVGTAFAAEVVQEISVNGRLAIPAGSSVRGHVTEARRAEKIGGRATLSITFDELRTPGGDVIGITAHLAQRGKSEVAKDAAIIGGSTIGGAILGDAVHDGEGGTVGAIVGGIAGTIGALKTKGKPVVLPAGTRLHITLENSVEVRS